MTTTPRKVASRTPRRPQDRKPKAATGNFSFVHKGKTFVFPNSVAIIRQPKFQRANRRRDPLDLGFTMIEALAGDDQEILDAIDEMDEKEFAELDRRLGDALQGSNDNPDAVGESEAS